MEINLLKYISICGNTKSQKLVKFGMNFEEVLSIHDIIKTASGQCPNAVLL